MTDDLHPTAFETPSLQQLTGRADDHVVVLDPSDSVSIRVHPHIIPALTKLRKAAAESGFEIKVASGFRDYQRQRQIWNAKATGLRVINDSFGRPLDTSGMNADEVVKAILHWSMLPGCSRHHWGTDIDVYDARAVPEDYQVQLDVAECEGSGPFAPFHQWLGDRLSRGECFGFFRPYVKNSSAVAVEPWHLSWAPLALRCQQFLTPEVLLEAVVSDEIELCDEIKRLFPEIYQRYIQVALSSYPGR